MKVIKFNERISENEIEIGDYLLCKINVDTPLYIFINSHISQLINTYVYKNIQTFYVIEFESVPKDIKPQFTKNYYKGKFVYTYEIGRGGIMSFGKDKEKLELMLATNKFNI